LEPISGNRLRVSSFQEKEVKNKTRHPNQEKMICADKLTVDDFVLLKASRFNKSQQLSMSGSQQIQYQSLKNLKFQRFQYALESGSGPGGRRFKSSLPDHSFQ